MALPLIGHPDRLEPLKTFLGFIAKAPEPILITGPTGSGKRSVIQFLLENGPLNQDPFFTLSGLHFSEELWSKARTTLETKGTLVIEGIHYLPLILQSRFKSWLQGKGPLLSEAVSLPEGWRIVSTSPGREDIWEELLYEFPFHLQLPSLNEVIEDIPFHIKFFLKDKPIRYLRYFLLLKTFFHQWPGNLRELEHYLLQAMAYYNALAVRPGSGGEEVFGERKLRYFQDVFKGEWWYYPYRFLPGFTEHLKDVLTKTDFRSKIIEENWAIPLLKDEPGFLVLDLKDPEFEIKALRIYETFSRYLTLIKSQKVTN
jgi:transcriptional regulator of acetoin/glycerol metabolism